MQTILVVTFTSLQITLKHFFTNWICWDEFYSTKCTFDAPPSDVLWKRQIQSFSRHCVRTRNRHTNLIRCFIIPPAQRSCWGGILVSLRPSVRPSVRPSRMPCPLCIIYSYGWILFILGTNDHYHQRVCRAPWPLTLTYIFKVIRPWLWKSCPLCSVYSSGWILSIFGTNDHYH